MKRQFFTILIGSLVLFSSCEKWLTVMPQRQATAEMLFESEKGYTDALIGVYMQLRSNYEPDEFFMATTTEYLANLYYTDPQTSDRFLITHDYSHTDVDASMGSGFMAQYKIISNINSLMVGMDTYGDQYLPKTKRNLIEGEARALRAFLHMDLLRLWGPMPAKAGSQAYLPYVKTVSTSPYTRHTYNEFVTLLLEDLNLAEQLLKTVDPILKYKNSELNSTSLGISEYKDIEWYYRQNRFNYYAVLALKARLYRWTGDTALAAQYAQEVINSQKFSLGNSYSFMSSDYNFFTEHIFGLRVEDFNDQTMFSSLRNPSCFSTVEQIDGLYSGNDIRKQNFLSPNSLMVNKTVRTTRKFNKLRKDSGGAMSVPVIRLSEMYLIAAESLPLADANELLKTFSSARGISLTLTEENKRETLLTEYMREFYGEGQIFFAYKRLAAPYLKWAPIHAMDEPQYVAPLPTGETGNYK